MAVASLDARVESGEVRDKPHASLYALLTLMIFFWSLNYAIGKIALREFPPMLLTTVRTFIAAAVMMPLYAMNGLRRATKKLTAREKTLLVVLGVFGVALNQVFFVLGLSRTSVAHSSILIALTPLQVLLLAAVIGQEKLTWGKAMGLVVALSGVATLQVMRSGGAAPSVLGDIFTLLCGLSLAAYTVFGKPVTARHDTVTMNTYAYVGGALALAPVLLWNVGRFDFSAISIGAWLSVAYMAIFSSVASYLIYSYALAHIAASRVSAFSYLQPLLATLIAIPVLGEHVSPPLWIGGTLVLAGVYITERG